MPEDYEGHPQRRDFPIGGEPVLLHPQRAALPEVHPVSDLETRPSAPQIPYREMEDSHELAPHRRTDPSRSC